MALVTQNQNAGTFQSTVAPFTGVNNGSARLLKAITLAELATLREGDIVYVMSVRDYWKWLPNSAIASNDITYCAPTVVGGGNGRFERLILSSPDWLVTTTTWCIASTGNDENTGVDLANALLTTEERQRRWGKDPYLDANVAQHVRYLTDGYSDVFELGRAAVGAVIYVHGSINDREGKTPPLASGVATTVQALNTATNTPWAVTTASFANWAGLSTKRYRSTSGANINALSWVTLQDGVTPSKTRLTDFLTPVASFTAAPFVVPANNDAGPANGDTFVIEDLRSMSSLDFRVVGDTGAANVRVVLDSVLVTQLRGTDGINLYADGSRYATPTASRFLSHTAHNCVNAGFQDTGNKTIVGGFASGGSPLTSLGAASTINKYTIQAGVTNTFSLDGSAVGGGSGNERWSVGRIGAFDMGAGSGFIILSTGVRMGATSSFVFYGSGNTDYLIRCCAGAISTIDNTGASRLGQQPIVTAAAFAVRFADSPGGAARTACPALDPATNLYTANRNLSFANIDQTVALGGFGTSFVDPVTGCGFTGH